MCWAISAMKSSGSNTSKFRETPRGSLSSPSAGNGWQSAFSARYKTVPPACAYARRQAAVEEVVHGATYDRPPEAVLALKAVGINLLELVEALFEQAIENRLPRFARAMEASSMVGVVGHAEHSRSSFSYYSTHILACQEMFSPRLSESSGRTGGSCSTAEATADYYIEQTPVDGVPYWDTGGRTPNLHRLGDYLQRQAEPVNDWEPVDSSAAAIAAQGVLRLGLFLLKRNVVYIGVRYRFQIYNFLLVNILQTSKYALT